MLEYVQDLRDHPATHLLAQGVPITISPDDPAPLGYDTVAYDWWLAYVAWELDLRGLKQLALNSIQYSALDSAGKKQLSEVFKVAWAAFVLSTDPQGGALK